MKIGLDFDGVIARQLPWPEWLPDWVIRWFLIFLPEMPDLDIARAIGREHQLIIVTSRSDLSCWITRAWLKLHKMPYAKLYCIGRGRSKAFKLKQEHVDIFFDDRSAHVTEARSKGINAHVFYNWRQAEQIIIAAAANL